MPTEAHKLTAVGYVRRSTVGQEASIPEQTKAIAEYAEKHGYEIIRWYTDDAISGDDTANRTGFKTMLADAQQKGDFELIVCWDQSRFGRFSPQECGYWTFQFSKADVALVTVDKGRIDWNDFTGWLTFSVDQHSKHDFLKQLSKDVVRGQKEAAAKGSWLGSPPYGYVVEGVRKNKRLVVDDPAKVAVVRRIFEEYVHERRSMGDIAARLQSEGFAPPGKGRRAWRYDSVRHILENPAYTGDFVSGRFSYGKYNAVTGKERRDNSGRTTRNPRSTWTVVPDTHKAVIDRDTFERAQETLARGKTGVPRFSRDNSSFLLSGLLRCGKCGSPMWGDTVKCAKFYRCGNWQTNGVSHCEGTKVREQDVLTGVTDHLTTDIFALDFDATAERALSGELTPETLPKAYERVRSMVIPPVVDTPTVDRRAATRAVKKLDAAIEKAQKNLVLLDAENIPAAQEVIRTLRVERDGLEAELSKKPPTEADINARTIEVLRALWWMRSLFASAVQEANHPTEEDRERLCEEIREDHPGETPALMTGATNSPELRRYLGSVVVIVCHSRKVGKGTATRHVFERGDITFRVGGKHEGVETPACYPLLTYSFTFGPPNGSGSLSRHTHPRPLSETAR